MPYSGELSNGRTTNRAKLGVKLTPMRDHITGGYRRALWVLLGAVGLVLLIACINLANLNLVRASARRKEMSILSALRATSWQVVKQLLFESALLATAGGALGVFFSRFGVQGLLALTPANIPRAGEIGLDASVLAEAVSPIALSSCSAPRKKRSVLLFAIA
jgi:putative ABC transport system permease protein